MRSSGPSIAGNDGPRLRRRRMAGKRFIRDVRAAGFSGSRPTVRAGVWTFSDRRLGTIQSVGDDRTDARRQFSVPYGTVIWRGAGVGRGESIRTNFLFRTEQEIGPAFQARPRWSSRRRALSDLFRDSDLGPSDFPGPARRNMFDAPLPRAGHPRFFIASGGPTCFQ